MRFRKPTKPTAEEDAGQEKDETGRADTWTQGSSFLGKTGIFCLYVAIACGPLALVVSSVGGSEATEVVAADQQAPLSEIEQEAGSYAASFVGAWLSATQEDSKGLDQYVNTKSVRLTDKGWKYKDLAPASIKREEDGFVTVVVAANVLQMDYEKDEAGKETWPRRYFQVVVQTDSHGGMGVFTFPTPVAEPDDPVEAAETKYGQDLTTKDPAGETTQAFLNAYLAGSGELDRYIAPGTDISALAPAPYAAASVEEIQAVEKPVADPKDGDTLHVLAGVNAQNESEQTVRADYALTLQARAGRWEITSIDTMPAHKSSDRSDETPSESPSTTPSQKGQ